MSHGSYITREWERRQGLMKITVDGVISLIGDDLKSENSETFLRPDHLSSANLIV